ncbi:exported hypothetical protein [Hyphomicrobiales bacterium]|nr:exported hypothetical protein [Hyphomicrobiales bacterium]CAH1699097.1 exported hypothetical protein [Hyphomicrobiales bacterium]CAI0342886.1 exported hypothetical protein [Hyphomicrobiales bacterium]
MLLGSASLLAVTLANSSVAHAQLVGTNGGNGGNASGGTGGAGGTGGTAGDSSFVGGAGGVGGVNGVGGAGGGPAGGATGSSGSGTGRGGGPDSGGGGGSSSGTDGAGGGGGGGGRGATVTSTLTNTTTITGGDGGSGGNASGNDWWAGGGGGGGGGAGAVLDGTAIVNSGTITGGNGGNGGVGAGTGYIPSLDDGTGGTGGSGIVVNTTTGATIDNTGSIAGGNGGTGNGPQGAAGVGISGQNLTVINAGTISAGSGSGSIDALRFTGGVNTLTLVNPTSGLSGNIAIQAGSLTFSQTSDVTVSNVILGAGSVGLTGPGKLTLTGMNTYTGATTIAVGSTLALSGQGRVNASSGVEANGIFDVSAAASAQIQALTGAATGVVELGATALIVNNASGTFAGAIHGTGGLQITGGTQTLTGASDFSGGAGISAGATLRIGDGGTSGSITSDVTNYGTLVFNRSDETTYAGVVTGPDTSAVSVTGGGKLILTGTSSSRASVTIDAGTTLQLGSGGTSGWIGGTGAYVGSINNNGALVYNRSNNVSYAGVISGTGSVEQAGPGVLTLTGTHTYTGATSITGGTLVVNGSIASSSGLTIAPGARLSGSGQVPGVVITGTLAPGNSPGTLTVNGNLTLASGSVYEAEVQGAVSDRVNVTGTASLAGALRIIPLGGAYMFNSPYTLLSAQGGRSGEFSPAETTGSFGDGVGTTVSYTATDVQLTLTPKPLAPIIESPATPKLGVLAPRNAFAIASAIDGAVAAGANASSLFGIYNLPAASIPAAVNQLSGEVHTAAPAMAQVAADQFLRSMLDPMAQGRLNSAAPGPGAAAFSGLVRKGAEQPVAPSRLDIPFYSVWGSAFGSYGRTDGNAAMGSARRSIDDAHLATGIDVRLMPGTVAGIAVSGGKANASLPGLLGKIDADVFQAGLYGVTQLGPVKLGAAASYAWLDNDVSRSIPALGSTLSSSYETTAWSGRLQASAVVFDWGGLAFSPLAAVQATRARNPAVVEANWAGASAGALALGKRSEVTSRSELGLQLDTNSVFGGVPVTGYVRAAWAHYFQRDADVTASLIGLPGAAFTATGAQADRNSALIAAGISAKFSERVSFGLNLDGELSADSRRLGGSAQVRVSF